MDIYAKTSCAGFRESPDIQCIPLTNTNTHTLQQREVSCGYKLCTGSREKRSAKEGARKNTGCTLQESWKLRTGREAACLLWRPQV